jgi:hypothetical protein
VPISIEAPMTAETARQESVEEHPGSPVWCPADPDGRAVVRVCVRWRTIRRSVLQQPGRAVGLLTVTMLGDLFLRAAARGGYDGPAARAYLDGRLGHAIPDALLREAVPADWVGCEAVAARHGFPTGVLWDLLLEDRVGA